MVKISLCLIVKNEEACLGACLRSVFDMSDEIVVVDKGSTDQTKEIAFSFGARVYDYAWVDDFAAARNEGVRRARGQWIFWLDADETVDDDNRRRLKALFERLSNEPAGYYMRRRSIHPQTRKVKWDAHFVRVFPNDARIRWQYRIHEQILPSLHRMRLPTHWTDIVIDHSGYQDRIMRTQKLKRNLRLLRIAGEETPEDAYINMSLGWTYLELSRCLFQNAIANDPADSWQRLLLSQMLVQQGNVGKLAEAMIKELLALRPSEGMEWRNLVGILLRQERKQEALNVLRLARSHCPNDPELLQLEALVLNGGGIG